MKMEPKLRRGPKVAKYKRMSAKNPLREGEQAKARIISAAESLFTTGLRRRLDAGHRGRGRNAAGPRLLLFRVQGRAPLGGLGEGGLELLHRVVNQIASKTDLGNEWETACVAHTTACSTGDERTRRSSSCRVAFPESIQARVSHCGTIRKDIHRPDRRSSLRRSRSRYLPVWPSSGTFLVFFVQEGRDTPAAIPKKMLSMLRAGIETRTRGSMRPHSFVGLNEIFGIACLPQPVRAERLQPGTDGPCREAPHSPSRLSCDNKTRQRETCTQEVTTVSTWQVGVLSRASHSWRCRAAQLQNLPRGTNVHLLEVIVQPDAVTWRSNSR